VKPILDTHCVRCHGANDTLSGDPTVRFALKAPLVCYLQRYEDEGCEMGSTTCKHGAAWCGGAASGKLIVHAINDTDDSQRRMPPLPADRLNDWEIEVLARWSDSTAP
jgi:mono/diheme cytochrome c family protein